MSRLDTDIALPQLLITNTQYKLYVIQIQTNWYELYIITAVNWFNIYQRFTTVQ